MAGNPTNPSLEKLQLAIRRQFAYIQEADNITDRARRIGRLNDLIAQTLPTSQKLEFGVRQEDAAEFLAPILGNLSPEEPFLAVDELINIQDGLITLEIKSEENQLSQLLPEGLLTKDSTDEIAICLGRFDDQRRKVRKNIQLDEIEIAVSKENGGKDEKTFVPTAFILHNGSSINGGHYTAYVKEANGWFLYDDSHKTPVTDDELKVAKQQAYIIKYTDKSKAANLIPTAQEPSRNLGNTCWANASLAFVGSFRTFDYTKKLSQNRQETNSEEWESPGDLSRLIDVTLENKWEEFSISESEGFDEFEDLFLKNSQSDVSLSEENYANNLAMFYACFKGFGELEITDDKKTIFSYFNHKGKGVFYSFNDTDRQVERNGKALNSDELAEDLQLIQTVVADFDAAQNLKPKVQNHEPKPDIVSTLQMPEKTSDFTDQHSLNHKEAKYQNSAGKEFTAHKAAEVKIDELITAQIIKEDISAEMRESLAKITAKGIETKANEKLVRQEVQTNDFATKNYERHRLTDFTDVNFTDVFMNSFANCTFSGNCKFGNIAANNNRFANCTFSGGDTEQTSLQAEQLIKLEPERLIGCKFSEDFMNNLGDKEDIFKKHFTIERNDKTGLYNCKTPSRFTTPLSAFKLKESREQSRE